MPQGVPNEAKIPWTDDLVQQVTALWSSGKTAGQIAYMLNISRNAVIGKINRLKLERPRQVITWNQERIDELRSYRLQALSYVQIAEKMGTTEEAIKKASYIHRDKLGPKAPKENRASGSLQGKGMKLHLKWKVYEPNPNTMFFYRHGDTQARYTFRREKSGTHWKGHGVYAMSRTLIYKWINLNGS